MYSDKEIIECLKKRQGYIYTYLEERYMPMIRLLVYQLGGNLEDAKDMFHEGLLIMYYRADDKDFVLTCKFKTFLYCVCKNLWLSRLQNKRAASNFFSRRIMDKEEDLIEILDYKLYESILYEIFETIDQVSQRILELYWLKFSPKEIADTLGYTYGYVKKKKCEGQAGKTIPILTNHPIPAF